MKKLFVSAAALITIHAAPTQAIELPVMTQSPMVLVELQASMKADLILAERRMGWEIQDELETQYIAVLQERHSNNTIAKLTTESIIDWTEKSDD